MPIEGAARLSFSPSDDIVAAIRRHAAESPNAPALRAGAEIRTYAALARRIDEVAGGLAELGVRPGQRAAILAKNSIAYVELFFGALAAGASVVPLPTLASEESLSLMLNDSNPVLYAADESHRAALDAAIARTTHGAETGAVRIGLDFEQGGYRALSTLSAPPPAVTIRGDDEFDVLYSSGTTGVPKGIVHSHVVRKASYAGSRRRYFDESSINVITTPFYSNTTCVTWLLTTAAGGTNVLMSKFEPAAFLSLVAEHRATHAMLVPVQHERILGCSALTSTDVSSLRFLFSTSAPLRAETKRAILDRFDAELVEIYGTTEGGVVTSLSARQHPNKLGTVGKPGPDCDIRIIDAEGREVEPGSAGEVVGRAANMMCGYLNRPDATAEVTWLAPDGRAFLRSGDVGRFDEDGFLHLLDRLKDVIISGGFNVYATDLEAVLLRHPAVLEAAVIGIPSERWGETPLGIVVVQGERRPSTSELLDFCNRQLGKAQRLHDIALVDELPKNAIGKILKRELRAPYWSGSEKGR